MGPGFFLIRRSLLLALDSSIFSAIPHRSMVLGEIVLLRFAFSMLVALLLYGCSGSTQRGKIVFQSNRDGNFEIYSMEDDGTNLRRLTNSLSYDVTPSWSPDGSRILFASDRAGNWDIYSMQSTGEDVKRLTSQSGSNTSPSWVNEGTNILFVSTRDAVNGELYIMNADGSDVGRLTRDSTVKDSPAMTPEGGSVLYSVNDRSGHFIASLRLSDKSISGLTPPSFNAASPAISPDGSLVLFSAIREGHVGIFTMTLTGENVKSLTPLNDDYRTPAWRGTIRDVLYSKNGGLYTRSLDTQREVLISNKGDISPHWVAN